MILLSVVSASTLFLLVLLVWYHILETKLDKEMGSAVSATFPSSTT